VEPGGPANGNFRFWLDGRTLLLPLFPIIGSGVIGIGWVPLIGVIPFPSGPLSPKFSTKSGCFMVTGFPCLLKKHLCNFIKHHRLGVGIRPFIFGLISGLRLLLTLGFLTWDHVWDGFYLPLGICSAPGKSSSGLENSTLVSTCFRISGGLGVHTFSKFHFFQALGHFYRKVLLGILSTFHLIGIFYYKGRQGFPHSCFDTGVTNLY